MTHFDHLPRRVSRGLALAALAAVLAVAAVTLSQCRHVGDSLTGAGVTVLNATLNAHSDCIHRCNDTFHSDHDAEVRRHDSALDSCGDDSDCVRAENRMHHDRQQAIVRNMQSCKKGCHSRGPGAAGN
jgi:hypothetical protein